MNHANPMVIDMMMQLSRKLFNAAQAGDSDLCVSVMKKSRETLDLYIQALEGGEVNGVTQ
jgi:hypothetical protein